jgi:IS5 family transposase
LAAHLSESLGWTPANVKLLLPPRQSRGNPATLAKLLETARRIHARQRHDKNKVYSVHEPEGECISKGKAGKKHEFGNKVSVVVTSRGGWLVGAKSFTGNPYDGHTPAAQLRQLNNLIGGRVSEARVDMNYRGHDHEGVVTVRVDKRQRGKTPRPLWRWMKRRAAVEPGIGHLKTEHRLERNRLKGVVGSALNAILSAAAMNFQKLLGVFWRNFLRRLLGRWEQFQLILASIGPRRLWAGIRM